MSGPFVLTARPRLDRRMDAGALAELLAAGLLTAERVHTELIDAVART